jgi:hypothetical protein
MQIHCSSVCCLNAAVRVPQAAVSTFIWHITFPFHTDSALGDNTWWQLESPSLPCRTLLGI